MGKLFAEPFATLSGEQHAAVAAWRPAVMDTAAQEEVDADSEEMDGEIESGGETPDQAVAA